MNIRQSVWVGLLLLLGATSLFGCSKKAQERRAGAAPAGNIQTGQVSQAGQASQKSEEAQKHQIEEGYGKAIDPYEKKNGRIGVSRPAK